MTNELTKANAAEVGTITTLGMDDEENEYTFAMLITFKSAEDIRAAMKAGSVEFTVFGE